MRNNQNFIEYLGTEKSNVKNLDYIDEFTFSYTTDFDIDEIIKISSEIFLVEKIPLSEKIWGMIFRIDASVIYISAKNNFKLSVLEIPNFFSLTSHFDYKNFSILNIKGSLIGYNKILLYFNLGMRR